MSAEVSSPSLKKWASRALLGAMSRAARNYIAGPELDDALRVLDRARSREVRGALGFWDGTAQRAVEVHQQYRAIHQQLARHSYDSYTSIKFPALGFSKEAVSDLLKTPGGEKIRIHFDSLWPESVECTWEAIERLRSEAPGAKLGATLPGRWRRSVSDIAIASKLGLAVRVVKGQWADPTTPELDPAAGFLAVIENLKGKVPLVGVATHDPLLLERSLKNLADSGSQAEVELLYGLPSRRCLAIARRYSAPVRLYIPYGTAYLPYCLSKLKTHPKLLLRLLLDDLAYRPGHA